MNGRDESGGRKVRLEATGIPQGRCAGALEQAGLMRRKELHSSHSTGLASDSGAWGSMTNQHLFKLILFKWTHLFSGHGKKQSIHY